MHTYARLATLAALPVLALIAGCTPDDIPPPPTATEVAGHYEYGGDLDVAISGNVARITVTFDRDEYARGGDLWAKGFPYIFLFSPGTRDALEAHRGLGGVRVVSLLPDGDTIAQALLQRAELNELGWRRAISIAASARRDGTASPARMRDLVDWGEDHTEFEYNPDHIARP